MNDLLRIFAEVNQGEHEADPPKAQVKDPDPFLFFLMLEQAEQG